MVLKHNINIACVISKFLKIKPVTSTDDQRLDELQVKLYISKVTSVIYSHRLNI